MRLFTALFLTAPFIAAAQQRQPKTVVHHFTTETITGQAHNPTARPVQIRLRRRIGHLIVIRRDFKQALIQSAEAI